MKRKFIALIMITLMSFSLTGCFLFNPPKTYNSTDIEDKNKSEDKRVKTAEGLPVNFELISCESLAYDNDIYIVRDKQTKIEYILADTSRGIAITPRIQEQK